MRFLVPRPMDIWTEMDEFFNRAFQFPAFAFAPFALTPPVDVEETDEAYIVTAELPGFDKKDIEIELRNNVLIIKGERVQNEGRRFLRRERASSVTRFERRIQLPGEIAHDRVTAEFNKGELVITLPKADAERRWSRRGPGCR